MKKIITRIQLDPDMFDWLKQEAAKRRVSMAQIIREFILPKMTENQKQG